jgi:hypothetical protein
MKGQVFFDDEAQPAATVDFDWDSIEPPEPDESACAPSAVDAIARLLLVLMHGALDCREIGERAVLLAARIDCKSAPARTARQVANWLECSPSTACKRLRELDTVLPGIIEDSASPLHKPDTCKGREARKPKPRT